MRPSIVSCSSLILQVYFGGNHLITDILECPKIKLIERQKNVLRNEFVIEIEVIKTYFQPTKCIFILQKWMTITHSSSEECNWGLTKKQMYFDFVPPSLNNFEYFLTKLVNIEEALHRHYPNKSPEPTLSRYKSFTFVFGNHIDLSQASSALFNAEPGKLRYLT